MHLSRTIAAFLRRDFEIATSYKVNFVFQLTYGYFIVAVFYFMAKLMDGGAAREALARYQADYFSFILIGAAVAGLMQASLNGFADQLRMGMTEGSLEMTFSCPVRPTWVIVLPCVWSMVFETLKACVVIAMGIVLFGADLGRANLASTVLMVLATVASYSVFGLLVASMILVLKRGDVLNTAFSAATAMIGGAFFPVELLPPWLGFVAQALPMTYAYDGLRLGLLAGATPVQLLPQLAKLLAFAAVGLPLAFMACTAAIARAKRDGSLGVF
ncbi:ABC transporter permease [Ideonella sp. DXS22W]|uniref:Transport permease protein n=1 Tax=Pseudaquabacterium inlustre TaxID=2984192 RepID=A0ABU9CK97_9BURK